MLYRADQTRSMIYLGQVAVTPQSRDLRRAYPFRMPIFNGMKKTSQVYLNYQDRVLALSLCHLYKSIEKAVESFSPMGEIFGYC